MCRVKLIGSAVLVVLALGAIFAGGASAGPAILVLSTTTVGGEVPTEEPILPGEGVEANLGSETCFIVSSGTLTTNGQAKDKLALGTSGEGTCEAGSSASGTVQQVELTSSGKATFKFAPKLTIAEPGPCVYEATKATGTFLSRETLEDIALTGEKLNKRASSRFCSSRLAGLTVDLFGQLGSILWEVRG